MPSCELKRGVHVVWSSKLKELLIFKKKTTIKEVPHINRTSSKCLFSKIQTTKLHFPSGRLNSVFQGQHWKVWFYVGRSLSLHLNISLMSSLFQIMLTTNFSFLYTFLSRADENRKYHKSKACPQCVLQLTNARNWRSRWQIIYISNFPNFTFHIPKSQCLLAWFLF